MASRAVVTGLGLRCPVGQNAVQSAASIRAGISRFAEWPYFSDSLEDEEAPLIASALVPDLGNESWMTKFPGLAFQPLCEALWSAGIFPSGESAPPLRLGIFLGLPPKDRPGIDADEHASFEEDLTNRDLLPFPADALEIVHGGQSASLLALERAMKAVVDGQIQTAVVGGVDSLLHSDFLFELLKENKLKTETTPIGLIPGEAGAFVVLETAEQARQRGAEILAELTPVRSGREAVPAGQPSLGEGVTRVLLQALADAPCGPEKIHRVLVDLNGERWRFLEWALADARMPVTMPPDRQIWHPADCLGDLGAATGIAYLCLAARAFQRGYAVGSALPTCTSSDSGERAAVCVLPPGQS